MAYFIFGGDGYYADGGARDLIMTLKDKRIAESTAKTLIGLKVPMKESWMDPEDWCDMTIEWSQVMDETGAILFEFGRPYGKGGHFEFKGIVNQITYIKEE